MQNVVGHDNGAVYHQIQRDSDTRQRIKLHLKSEEVVEDKCHRYIYSQAGNYQKRYFNLRVMSHTNTSRMSTVKPVRK